MSKKVVALASDHAGFELKEELKKYVRSLGYDTVDLGPDNGVNKVSYATQGNELAEYINSRKPDFGIGVCGTGLGISYALNRHKHIRAARITSVEDAHLAKQHNNANVLVFGGRQLKTEDAIKMIDEYLKTDFEGGRHIERIEELDK
ncbi:RpiB/LacA/LacB family sugar-phosphate isomerase [Mycoplasma sp. CSL10137]|uniref:RpiB/LacA/LacB family sugar-phosphate isomerase n=1 Tax=unclassified Mycoplasma TaxID=2683645 RepID=UPI00197BCA18|nr:MULTISPECIES: RpiB/LacA/LacB family sugar-phosphate isomerase [unclassified Mycoplasma]MBN4083211.1 RpiB/LacA/LacB family sugar-phosphate isomerase [Mycoplasma sp. CSL10137]MBN4084493.1 RpiB/LacA/LacB family sugar-phosphate isomerase [Mycoplasma sp. CSL10166]MBU4692972.1 RpiB/LacA/LacB family sugar-phosphate isomerase [Mycoplasma sp. CSL7491-lung]